MNKELFLVKLSQKLSSLPTKDIDKAIEYYSEIIADRIEDGISEENAVNELGNIDEIADSILNTQEDVKHFHFEKVIGEPVYQEQEHKKTNLTTTQIILIIILFPIWFPILITVFSVLWSLVIAYFAIIIFSCFATFSGLISALMLFINGSISGGFINIASSFIAIGLALILVVWAKQVLYFGINNTKKIYYWIKNKLMGGSK